MAIAIHCNASTEHCGNNALTVQCKNIRRFHESSLCSARTPAYFMKGQEEERAKHSFFALPNPLSCSVMNKMFKPTVKKGHCTVQEHLNIS